MLFEPWDNQRMSTSTTFTKKFKGPDTLQPKDKWQPENFGADPKSASLADSQYRTIYDKYAQFKENAEFREGMKNSALDFLNKYFVGHFDAGKTDFDSVAESCVKLYTSQEFYDTKKFYLYLNHAIYSDNALQLSRLMPVIRMINYYLTQDPSKQHTKPCIVYRGANLPAEKLATFQPQVQFRFATILSTSLDPKVATEFTSSTTLFVIEVPAFENAPHYRCVKSISKYAYEEEVIFVAFSRFEVLSCNTTMQVAGKTYNVIRLQAHDNHNPNNPLVSQVNQQPTKVEGPKTIVK